MARRARLVLPWARITCLFMCSSCTQSGRQIHAAPPNSTSQPSVSGGDAPPCIEEQVGESSRYVEAELAKWSPKAADLQVPPEKLRDSSIEVEGDWIGRTGMDSARMSIQRRSSNDYDIDFATSGCLSHWELRRTGTYRDGVLTLDRPVQEYCPITFKTLYAIRVDGKELLLPASNVSNLLKDLDDDGRSRPNTIGVRFYTYGRRADRDPARLSSRP